MDRVGERRLNKEGHEMTIITYRTCNDIMVRFENGTIKDHVKYQHFRDGAIKMPVIDHLGNEYPSRLVMCKHYGIDYNLFKKRLKYGWPLEKALSAPQKQNITMTDHKGIEHESKRQMARQYNLNEKTLRKRLKSGWDVENALTITPNKSNRIKRKG